MERGRGKKKNPLARYRRYTTIALGLAMFFAFAALTIANHIFSLLSSGVDLFGERQDLQRLSMYMRPIDKGIADFGYQLNEVIQAYMQGENIFITKTEEVDKVRSYIANHHESLEQRGFGQYEQLFTVIANLYPHKEEVYQLMGSKKPFNYLIILQNTGEKRPNGGFFGSFVFVTLDQGKITKFVPIDAYFPNSIAPDTLVTNPPRANLFLPDNKIGFVAANKFGFTDLDGRHIKILYEQIFNRDYDIDIVNDGPYVDVRPQLVNQYIKGVVFLRSDMFEELLPGFRKKVRERQFVNASVDIIRGEERGNKKELYMEEMRNYFDANRTNIVSNILENIDAIQTTHGINIYLSNVSDGLQSFLRQEHFTTTYDTQSIYLRDFNRTYSKVDRFITKEVIIKQGSQIIAQYFDQDVIPARDLTPGEYQVDIYYHLNIPKHYVDFISTLEKKYAINLTQRERIILGLEQGYNNNFWATQGLIHFPYSRDIRQIQGDAMQSRTLYSPFSHIVDYTAQTQSNNSTTKISVAITIPQRD